MRAAKECFEAGVAGYHNKIESPPQDESPSRQGQE